MDNRLDIRGYTPAGQALLRTSQTEIAPHIARLGQVFEEGDYTSVEASINVPFDEDLLSAVEAFASQFATSQLRYVFLVGIGGSNLGTDAIYQALRYSHIVSEQALPKLITLDTNSAALLSGVSAIIETIRSPEEFAVVTVSKSGGTTETLANTEILLTLLEAKCGPVPHRVIVISDNNSPYVIAGQELKMHTFAMPPNVGGRYSVFTAVGLVPLALLGLPIRELVSGAAAAVQRGQHQDLQFNEAAQLALLTRDAYEQGLIIHNLFLFARELETLGKWWRQLTGESLGKETIDKKSVIGITPTVAIGSTDLHSMGQLYLGGANQTFSLFVSTAEAKEFTVPSERVFPQLVPMIKAKSVADIQTAILAGTKAAYTERDRRYVEWRMPTASAYELGYFMQTMMLVVIFTGRLLQVNPFNQPDVEAYKLKTKELLETS